MIGVKDFRDNGRLYLSINLGGIAIILAPGFGACFFYNKNGIEEEE